MLFLSFFNTVCFFSMSYEILFNLATFTFNFSFTTIPVFCILITFLIGDSIFLFSAFFINSFITLLFLSFLIYGRPFNFNAAPFFRAGIFYTFDFKSAGLKICAKTRLATQPQYRLNESARGFGLLSGFCIPSFVFVGKAIPVPKILHK